MSDVQLISPASEKQAAFLEAVDGRNDIVLFGGAA
jgi:hypothetical protein